ncbi:hypothetical protein ACFL9U_05540 [Thermodesulfobacteriota bacterium]
MNDKIRYILERLPDKSHLIDLLMEKDPEFVAICEDYNDCVNALWYWGRSKAPEAEIRVKEYRTLVEGLEEEIHWALEAFNPRRLD